MKLGENMKKRRLKKSVIYALILIIAGTLFLSTMIKNYKYHQSYPYKFEKLGYTKEEAKILSKNSKEESEKYLSLGYQKDLINLIQQKYFINDNLDAYLNYLKKDSKKSLQEVVSIINVGADKDWYEKPTKTDLSKEELMLVNKFNFLEKSYQPKDITEIALSYSYDGNSIKKEAYDAFTTMADKAEKEDINLIVSTSYRTYEQQEKTYNAIKQSSGTKSADQIAARPGFSEHQTGLALDIDTFDSYTGDFDQTEAFRWLKKNAHKYGFILRYPKGKEDITGFKYEPWHFRFVGIDVATKIYNADITFDEYYAYYLK